MATVNKDFKIKSGLIVEGTTGTINNFDILTKSQASQDYIVGIIGGETLVTSVDSDQLVVTGGELSILTNTFDAYGSASDAQAAAEGYADGLAVNYDAAGSASAAQTAAQSYADGLAVNYDAAGAASTAETNANNYTNTALEDYTPTASLDATVDGYGYLKSADLSGYATESYVGTAIDNLVDGAPGLLDTLNEIAAAINDDENYATTMTTALAGKQNNLTAGSNIDITNDTVSVTGLDTDDVSEGTNLYFTNARAVTANEGQWDTIGAANTAEQNAATYTDNAINALDTDVIEEGEGNLYFTDGRAAEAAADLLTSATLTNITITGSGAGLTITAENGVADSTTDDLAEGEDNLYFTDARAQGAVNDTTPNFAAIEIDLVAKQVAALTDAPTAGVQVGHAFAKADYRSAEYLVKVAYGTHTEISKVLLTLDTSDNIAITEYGIVGTNGSASTISAGISGADVQLLVTTANNNSTVTVMGTLLV